jgi:YHS domain-containing protein
MTEIKMSFLAEINIQTISEPNETNFKVSMAGGHYTFGKPEHYNKFVDKYLTWLEMR